MDEPTYWLFHNNHFVATYKLGTLYLHISITLLLQP